MLALQAKFGSDELFDSLDSLRIAPAVTSRFTAFDEEMARFGHEYQFTSGQLKSSVTGVAVEEVDSSDEDLVDGPTNNFNVRRESDIEDIVDLLHAQETLILPNGENIGLWLREVYKTSRGFELGTFDSSILATTMKKQSSKWNSISLGYVSDVIVLVHRFTTTALSSICYDDTMQRSLFGVLYDGLVDRYKNAIRQVQFLLEVERNGTPMTTNHYFNDNLDKW